MGRRVLIVALLVSSAINLVAVFTFGYYWREDIRHRQNRPPPPGFENRNQNLDRLKGRLKLTDAQMDTIRKLQREFRVRTESLGQQAFTERQQLMDRLSDPLLDRTRTDSLFRATVALQDEFEEQVYLNMLQVRSLLNSEQRREMGELLHTLMGGDHPPDSGPALGPPRGGPPPEPPMGAPGH
jgi:Spy/CpxP family protein refolding chaperone